MQSVGRPIIRQPKQVFVPKLLESAMAASGWDEQETATAANVNKETVKGWLSGKSAPRGGLLLQLSLALEISPFDLYEAEE